jgi:Fe2+ or Zn2+ uptake regulation protein
MTQAPDVPAPAAADPDAAVRALRAAGLRMSTARRLVIEALFAASSPLSAAELARSLRLDESASGHEPPP